MITTTNYGGVQTTTIEEGDWRYTRGGWANPWTVTHTPSGITFTIGKTTIVEVREAVRDLAPDLFTETEPVETAQYTVEPKFDREFTGHRRGEIR